MMMEGEALGREGRVRKLLMCRLCSSECDGGIMAFSDEGLIRTVQQHIKKYLYITVTMDDKFTKYICAACLKTLENFHQFAMVASQTQKKLIQATRAERLSTIEDMHYGLLHAYLTKDSIINDHDYATSETEKAASINRGTKKPARKRNRSGASIEKKSRARRRNRAILATDIKEHRDKEHQLSRKVEQNALNNNDVVLDASDSNTHETLEVVVDPSLYLENSCDSLCSEKNNNMSLGGEPIDYIREGLFADQKEEEESECPCPICGRTEFTSNDLKLHLRIHRPKGKHECNICKRVFKTDANLVQHKIYHDGGQFKCETCQRMYPTQSTLKAHAITHSDLRPHQCQLCHKSFKRNQDLKFHMNQHTGERPYKCIYCPKAFASSGNCFSHRKRMHPDEVERDRNFAAKICL